jgi:hypothetical protein
MFSFRFDVYFVSIVKILWNCGSHGKDLCIGYLGCNAMWTYKADTEVQVLQKAYMTNLLATAVSDTNSQVFV